ADLLPRHDLAGSPGEQLEQARRLGLEPDPGSLPQQLAAVRPQLIGAEEQADSLRAGPGRRGTFVHASSTRQPGRGFSASPGRTGSLEIAIDVQDDRSR